MRDPEPRPIAVPAVTGHEVAALLAIALWLAGFFAWPFLRGHGLLLGNDVPTYVWWSHVVSLEGPSAVAARPAIPALLLALSGALHVPLEAVAASMGSTLGIAAGLTGGAVVSRASPRSRAWILGSVFCGVFAMALVSGYLANLALAVTFLGALAVLAGRGTGRVPIATMLLVGGGAAHPLFFVLAVAILGGAALLTARPPALGRDRRDARDALLALIAAGIALAVLLGCSSLGGSPVAFETSSDAFLRHEGLRDVLASFYRFRFLGVLVTYGGWAVAAVAFARVRTRTRLLDRVLGVWLAISAAGVAVALGTALVPAHRFVVFAFAAPIVATVGLRGLRDELASRVGRRRALGVVIVAVVVLLGIPAYWWSHVPTYLTPTERASLVAVARAGSASPPGTPIVLVVDGPAEGISIRAALWANLLRACVPGDRIGDVRVFVGTPADLAAGRPTVRGDAEYDAASRRTLASIPTDGRRVLLVSTATDERLDAVPEGMTPLGHGAFVASGVRDLPGATRRDDVRPPAGANIVVSLALLLAIAAVGAGWVVSLRARVPAIAALAPALGLAAIVVAAVVLSLLGIPLSGSAGPTIAVVLAAVTGWVAPALARVRAVRGTTYRASGALGIPRAIAGPYRWRR